MSQLESSISSPAASAPPPASSATPSESAPPQAAAPSAVAVPVAPIAADVVATAPGAQPSAPAVPATPTLDSLWQNYESKKTEARTEGAQPTPPAEPASEVPAPQADTSLEAAPVADAPVEAKPAEEEAPAPVEAAAADTAAPTDDVDLEQILSAEDVESRYARKLSKAEKAEIAKREDHRGKLVKSFNTMGGEHGIKVGEAIMPILWKDEPTVEDVDTFLDHIVLPEHAGAGKFFDLLGRHVVNTQLQDPDTGPAFADQMLSENYGPAYKLETIDTLVKAHKAGLINLEFMKSELEGMDAPPEPSARELQLERENQELRTKTEKSTVEQERANETRIATYKSQARNWISRFIMEPVLPLARDANWSLQEGETGPQVERKSTLGSLVASEINQHIMGTVDAPSEEYSGVQKMINEGTAFDDKGNPTPRFLQKLNPLRVKAKAKWNEIHRILGPEFKFKAETSRNAQLVKQNGNGAKPTEQPPPPLITAPPPSANDKELTTQQKLDALREKLRQEERAALEPVGRLL